VDLYQIHGWDYSTSDALAALTLHLEPAEIAKLEAPYVPHAIVGHS
jgi:hypothetical protein